MIQKKLPQTGWIWIDSLNYDDGKPQTVYFRKVIKLDEKLKRAILKYQRIPVIFFM